MICYVRDGRLTNKGMLISKKNLYYLFQAENINLIVFGILSLDSINKFQKNHITA